MPVAIPCSSDPYYVLRRQVVEPPFAIVVEHLQVFIFARIIPLPAMPQKA
jgi:hypothetical protein